MAYVSKPEHLKFGNQVQCAAQCLDPGSDEYLVITDSFKPQRGSRTTCNVVQFSSDGKGRSWQNRLRERDVIGSEDLAIIASFKQRTSFAFWISGNKMLLAHLIEGHRSEPEDISRRFEAVSNH